MYPLNSVAIQVLEPVAGIPAATRIGVFRLLAGVRGATAAPQKPPPPNCSPGAEPDARERVSRGSAKWPSMLACRC